MKFFLVILSLPQAPLSLLKVLLSLQCSLNYLLLWWFPCTQFEFLPHYAFLSSFLSFRLSSVKFIPTFPLLCWNIGIIQVFKGFLLAIHLLLLNWLKYYWNLPSIGRPSAPFLHPLNEIFVHFLALWAKMSSAYWTLFPFNLFQTCTSSLFPNAFLKLLWFCSNQSLLFGECWPSKTFPQGNCSASADGPCSNHPSI